MSRNRSGRFRLRQHCRCRCHRCTGGGRLSGKSAACLQLRLSLEGATLCVLTANRTARLTRRISHPCERTLRCGCCIRGCHFRFRRAWRNMPSRSLADLRQAGHRAILPACRMERPAALARRPPGKAIGVPVAAQQVRIGIGGNPRTWRRGCDHRGKSGCSLAAFRAQRHHDARKDHGPAARCDVPRQFAQGDGARKTHSSCFVDTHARQTGEAGIEDGLFRFARLAGRPVYFLRFSVNERGRIEGAVDGPVDCSDIDADGAVLYLSGAPLEVRKRQRQAPRGSSLRKP